MRNALGGLFLLGMAIFYTFHIFETEDWSKSTATVESVRVFYQSEVHAKGEHRVDLRYGYEVDGVHYTGHSTSSGSAWESSARRTAEQFAVGKPINIIYDPRAPEKSEIKQQGWSGSFSL